MEMLLLLHSLVSESVDLFWSFKALLQGGLLLLILIISVSLFITFMKGISLLVEVLMSQRVGLAW